MTSLTQPSPQRALLYDRVSTANQAKSGYSSGAEGFQLDLCRAHADKKGYVVVGTRTDVDSGAKWDVDGLLGAIQMAKRGEFDILIVADSGRFARNLGKKLVYEGDLRRHGVRVEYTNLPVEDSPEGRLVANMFGAYDEFEREKIAWRLGNGRRMKAKQGHVVGSGPAPYGYRYVSEWDDTKKRAIPVGLEPDPETAPIVQRIFRETVYASAIELARRLTAEHIPTPRGSQLRWGNSTIRNILRSPVHKGEWHYAAQLVPVPALVDRQTWDAAQQLLGERVRMRRGRHPDLEDPSLLRGLLTCGHCGGGISTSSNTTTPRTAPDRRARQRVYNCLRHQPRKAVDAGWQDCPLPMFDAAATEEHAWQLVTATLLHADTLRRNLQHQRAQHAEAWAERDARLATIDREIATLQRKLRRAAEERLSVERDDPLYSVYAQVAEQAGRDVAGLTSERAALAGLPMPGLSDYEVAALEAFAGEVAKDLATATPDNRRHVFQLIRLRGRVYRDPEGMRIGYRNRLRFEWDALIPLDSEHGLLKLCALSSGQGVGVVALERLHDSVPNDQTTKRPNAAAARVTYSEPGGA